MVRYTRGGPQGETACHATGGHVTASLTFFLEALAMAHRETR